MINNVANDISIEKEKKENPIRSVSIIALRDKDNKILLVRTKRLPNYWQPVGGGIEKGETPIEAAVRELYDETKLLFEEKNFIKVMEVPYDLGEGTIYCFNTNIVISNEMLDIDMSQMEEYKWYTLNEAKQLPMFPATISFINYLIDKDDE
jgi:ADP-ribose pyrophosphatase YjhB (NUDIX family)